MKMCVSLIAVIFLLKGLVFSQDDTGIRNRLIGAWKLVSAEYTMKNGSKRPYPEFGPNAKGFLIYSADGYMCAQLVNPDLPKWADSAHPTSDERLSTADGTFAYCGRYELDVPNQQIIHLPEVSTAPPFSGTRQVRPFQFEKDRLVLSGVETEEPGAIRWKIVWERAR